VLWNHDPQQPIARAIEIGVVDGRLQALVQFPPEGVSAKADEVYGLVKAGVVNATSVGFMPMDSEPMDKGQPYKGQRFIKSELMEFSFVSVPANRGATVVARRAPEPDGVARVVKGLREVGWFADLLQQIAALEECVEYEAGMEGDGSPIPDQLAAVMNALGQILIDMTVEEVAELLRSEAAETDDPMEYDDMGDDEFAPVTRAGARISAASAAKVAEAIAHAKQAARAARKAYMTCSALLDAGSESSDAETMSLDIRRRRLICAQLRG
jgi:HK97 family phage prohead protease